jgi:DNA primase
LSDFYSEDLIDHIRTSNDIVDVISEYVPLKKRGKNYVALCPFHAEKKPSFSVNPDKQIFYCFGCNQGGNVITFMMVHEKMSFVEAVKFLAQRANIPLPKKQVDRKTSELLDKLYYANQVATTYFQKSLSAIELGKKARSYFEKRGFDSSTIEKFSLGYAPAEWEGLIRFAKTKDLDVETLKLAGLVVQNKEGGYHDRFRNRIIFPIFSLSGKVIAFGGRVLNEEDEPKYLNSPETIIYQKGKTLYGLNFSKEAIRDRGVAIVVEGYMDFITLFSSDIQNLVASSGTAFTTEQARLLSRYAEKIYLLFDADSAGQKAALRSVNMLFDFGMEVGVVVLPPGEDPDSLVKKYGKEKLLEYINRAEDFIDYKIASLGKPFDQLSIMEQKKVIREFSETANNISHEVTRALFVKKVADKLRLKEEIVIKSSSPRPKDISYTKTTQPGELSSQEKIERGFLRILLEDCELIRKAENEIIKKDLAFSLHQELFELICYTWKKKGKFEPASLLDRAEKEDLKGILSQILSMDIGTAEPSLQLEGYLNSIKKFGIKSKIEELKKEIKEALELGNKQRADFLTEEYQRLKRGV